MNGDLVISYAGLQSASTDYSSASTEFGEATKKMIDALVETENNWKDASSAEWQSKISIAKKTFEQVAAKLANNAAVLTSVNNAVSESSANVKTAVAKM